MELEKSYERDFLDEDHLMSVNDIVSPERKKLDHDMTNFGYEYTEPISRNEFEGQEMLLKKLVTLNKGLDVSGSREEVKKSGLPMGKIYTLGL
jgi:hypothetical protein